MKNVGNNSGGPNKFAPVQPANNRPNPDGKNMARVVGLKFVGVFVKCLISILLVAVITGVIAGGYLAFTVFSQFGDVEGIPDLSLIGSKETSRYFVKNETGEFVEQFSLEGTKSIWADFENIPENMKKAVIAIEDHRFYEHNGVDWKRTAGAAANYFLRFRKTEFGGSSITQQVIKNATNDDKAELSRKIREILRALEMEKSMYGKDQILEAYLNLLPLSGNVTGVGAAANYYFNKDVENLTLAECAVIAGITQNPSKFNPYMRPDNVRSRQRVVLQEMFRHGFINEDEYTQAFNQELEFKNGMKTGGIQSYYADYVISTLINDFMAKGASKDLAEQMVYSGGLNIYSAEDVPKQEMLEGLFKDFNNFNKKGQKSWEQNIANSGITIMDYDGRVVALAGQPGEKVGNRVANTATERHNTGSSMKPIAAYAPALDKNLITYSSTLLDYAIMYDGRLRPPNYGGSLGSRALVNVDYAVKRSLNTVPARVFELMGGGNAYVGAGVAFDFLKNTLDMDNLIDPSKPSNDATLSLALGQLTYGVSTVEMAAAFQIFGNGGKYNTPYCYYKVTRRSGEKDETEEILLQTRPEGEDLSYDEELYSYGREAIGADTAYIMNQLLQGVVRPGNGGTAAGTVVSGFDTFGKTGTSNDNKDVYFAGGTPHYVVASWYGYKHYYDKDRNETTEPLELNGRETDMARSLWLTVMNEIHKGMPAQRFENTGGATQLTFCRTSGLIASSHCTATASGYYRESNIPRACIINDHTGEPINTDDGNIVTTTTTESTGKPTIPTLPPKDTTTTTTDTTTRTTRTRPTKPTTTTSSEEDAD